MLRASIQQYLAQLVLLLIHAIYGLKNLLFSFISPRKPKPLLAQRRKIPKHIAIILVPDGLNAEISQEEEAVLEKCVEKSVKWCKALEIPRLSIYERDGILTPSSVYASSEGCSHRSLSISRCTQSNSNKDPLTPPESDTESPQPETPKSLEPILGAVVDTIHLNYSVPDDSFELEKKPNRRRPHSSSKAGKRTLSVYILSRESSKPALALLARSLSHKYAATKVSQKSAFLDSLTVDALNNIIEVESGYPPPDLVIVYSLYPSTAPLELHGFPPWHIRLSEIYHVSSRKGGIYRQILRWLSPGQKQAPLLPKPISKWDFCKALDEYCDAEFRVGK